MKILKIGEVPKKNKIICDTCKTEFLYEQEDIKTERVKRIRHYMGSGPLWADYIRSLVSYVECPLCKKCFWVKDVRESIDTLTVKDVRRGRREIFEKQIKWND